MEYDFATQRAAGSLCHNRNTFVLQHIQRKANVIATDGVAGHRWQNIGATKYLGLQICAPAPVFAKGSQKLRYGDIAVSWVVAPVSVVWQHKMVHTADPAPPIPQAHGHTRPENGCEQRRR
jgi:hypothetical protein